MRLGLRRERLRRSNMPVIVKLAIFTVACLIGAGVIVAKVGIINPFIHRHGYKAVLPSASGLYKNDPVKISGVGVGKVTGIHLQHGRALVTFKVNDDVELRSGTRVGIRWRNLIGQRYLYLWPSDDGHPLHAGDTLPVSQAVATPDIGVLLNELGPLLQAIDPKEANAFVEALDQALSGNQGRINDLFSNAATISKTVGGLDTKVGSLLGNLDQLTGAVASKNQQLTETIHNVHQLAGTLNANDGSIDTLIDQVSQLLPQVQQILDHNLGDVDAIVRNLKAVSDTVAAHRGGLDAVLSDFAPGAGQLYAWTREGQYITGDFAGICVGPIMPSQSVCPLTSDTLNKLVPGLAITPTPNPASVYDFAATVGGSS